MWCGALAALAVLAPKALAFLNPILPGFRFVVDASQEPDPTIVAVGGDYFITSSTFEHFPAHPIYHSTDLVAWKLIGHGLNRPSQLQLYATGPEGGTWAPTLRYHDGTYYLFTTNRRVYTAELRQQAGSFYVTTQDIWSNNWSDPIYLDVLGYDPDLFIDDDGTAYVCRADWNGPITQIYGIYQSKIDLSNGRILSDALIYNGTLPLNSSARPEAPRLYKKDNLYYLILAEGGSGRELPNRAGSMPILVMQYRMLTLAAQHQVTVARSTSPSGPWTQYANNPIMYNGRDLNSTTQPVQWTGHADIFKTSNNEWWGVALAVRPQGGNSSRAQLGREVFLYPVIWSADQWPVLNNNQSLGLVGPGLYNQTWDWTSFYDDFSKKNLDLGYYYLRNNYNNFHTLSERPGYLRIYGNAHSLGDRDSVAVLTRKQNAFNQLFQTEVDFTPKTARQGAGVTAFYSDFFHQDLSVTLCPQNATSRCILWRESISTNETNKANVNFNNATNISNHYHPIGDGAVTLAIKSTPLGYSFGYAQNGANLTYVGVSDAQQVWRAPAGYGLYKGVQFGLFASGGQSSMYSNPADFAYFKQTTYAPDPGHE